VSVLFTLFVVIGMLAGLVFGMFVVCYLLRRFWLVLGMIGFIVMMWIVVFLWSGWVLFWLFVGFVVGVLVGGFGFMIGFGCWGWRSGRIVR